jgi:signal peptidase I
VILSDLLLLRRRFLAITVEGRSMEPTLRAGDHLLVRRIRLACVRHGQVVVIEIPDPPARPASESPSPLPPPDAPLKAAGPRLFVKRAIALPGDPLPRDLVPALRDLPETAVPAGRLVVLGDNPGVSWDSREYGYVREEQLVGVALRRLR